jgi:trehalose 6-phosphate synthase
LQDRTLFVISNREPYSHVYRNKHVECVVPPSGLVTALEPILRACGGTWIAQATGDADREVVDPNDHVAVPPEEPTYSLRRVWLTDKEEQGFYYGFANEGLWPLCHIAHTRPLFRAEDWDHYRLVNERFAEVALEEMAGKEEPYVLVQDYHFALLPRLIKDKRPDARVAIFWHIPWPNPESFGICPWQRQLLHGMLGADLIGFHIQHHCNNFLETVDGALESRIHREHFSVSRQGHTTWVRPIPISIAFNPGDSTKRSVEPRSPDPKDIAKSLGIQTTYLGVGVDRIDYTKGILERFRAIERFLEKNPTYLGEFTFVELGAPSRALIPRYRELIVEIQSETDRINQRFKSKTWSPIVLLEGQHPHEEIEPYYRAADVCLVTSLHDGMNLVAKEFIAARDNEDAALILSRFTGASRELRDAILINPYDIEQVADSIALALEMDPAERVGRMQRMRRIVRDQNIYRWGADLITELSEIRIEDRAGIPA